jgi:hypothetical protein
MQDPQPAADAPLRIGLLVNSLDSTRWVARIVAAIQASGFARVELVLRNAAPPAPPPRGRVARLRAIWRHSLFERYRRWDRARNAPAPELDAFAPAALAPLLAGVAVLDVVPAQKGFVDRIAPADVAQVRAARLDVLFRFGFRIVRGEILTAARCGVWSFHHGDNRAYRGAPPGFWEMHEGNPVTGSILQVLTDTLDGGRVLYRSWSATNFDSLYLSLNPLYWKTAEFALRRLRDLHRLGWERLQALADDREADRYDKPLYRTPAAPVMARFLLRLALRKLWRRALALLFIERTQWFVALRPRAGAQTALAGRQGFAELHAPPGRFYADPFLLERGADAWLFFEDYDFARGWADLSCARLDAQGRAGPAEPVLATGSHLSYPFVFEHGGAVYLLPETKQRGAIELYRALEFPHRWALAATLLEGVQAVDSTLFERDGRFWLFTNLAAPGASTFDELHLFHAPALAGPWTPHPGNPVVSDVRRARPAGRLFEHEGRLLRPSQDCALRYGHAIWLNEVLVLSPTEYRERPFERIGPEWAAGNLCTHTYDRSARFEVLDGMRTRRVLRGLS